MDSPVFKVELFKRNETDDLGGFNTDPVDISSFISADNRLGIETTKDTFSFKVINNLITSTGSFDLQSDKKSRIVTDIRVGDLVKIYSYDAFVGSSADVDNDLIMVGVINSFSHTNSETDNIVTYKGVNRSEQLLQGYALGTFDISDNENNSPKIINFIIRRLRSYGPKTYDRLIYSALDDEYIFDPERGIDSTNYPTGITGNFGNVASTKRDNTSFKEISYKRIWQPTYRIIEELSTTEFTGDEEAGAYIAYIKNTPVLPELQQKLRATTINELVWKPVSLSIGSTLKRGYDYLDVNSIKDTFDIKNILIIKAGADLEGNGITTFAINSTSVGKNGPRFGYLPLPNTVTKIISEEKKFTGEDSDIGSSYNTTGYPEEVFTNDDSWDFVTIYDRDDAYPYNTVEPSTNSTSDDKKGFNDVIISEAKAQAVIIGQKLVDTLGSPRIKSKLTLSYPSIGSFQIGDMVKVVDESIGWWDTTSDPSKKLRIHDIQHSFGDDWIQTLHLEEDEETIKSKYSVE
jgi:hypothetical protein